MSLALSGRRNDWALPVTWCRTTSPSRPDTSPRERAAELVDRVGRNRLRVGRGPGETRPLRLAESNKYRGGRAAAAALSMTSRRVAHASAATFRSVGRPTIGPRCTAESETGEKTPRASRCLFCDVREFDPFRAQVFNFIYLLIPMGLRRFPENSPNLPDCTKKKYIIKPSKIKLHLILFNYCCFVIWK